MRCLRGIAIAIVACGLAVGVAAQTKKKEAYDRSILKPMSTLLEDLTKMKKDFPAELFGDETNVIDSFPPYAWPGPKGAQQWYADFMKTTLADKDLSDQVITRGDPKRPPEVTGDRAYVIVPVAITWKEKGKPKKETGYWTVILQKKAGGWVILAHSYDIATETP